MFTLSISKTQSHVNISNIYYIVFVRKQLCKCDCKYIVSVKRQFLINYHVENVLVTVKMV